MKSRTLLVVVFNVLVTLLLTGPLHAQTTWYVDDDAHNDPGPGDTSISDPLEDGTVDHPFDAIQEGIDTAVNGDTVLVADGAYTGVGNYDIDLLGKAIMVKSENGAGGCVIDLPYGYRAFTVHSGESRDTVIEGFSVHGDVFATHPDSLTARGPWDGNGVNCSGSSPTIRDNVFYRIESWNGGAIYCDQGSPLITGNRFDDCEAEADEGCLGSGGAIYAEGGAPVISDNVINDNRAYQVGGGICCDGGTPEISRNVITNNLSDGAGGGIYCTGSPLIAQNTIIGNESGTCLSEHAGGGIYCGWGNPVITGNLIANNQNSGYGGGIACGTFTIEPLHVEISHCTFFGNSAGLAGGALHCDYSYWDCSVVNVANCIFWGNSAPQGDEINLQYETCLNLLHCTVEGGPAGINVDEFATLNMDGGNMYADPLFVSGPGGDYYLSQVAAGQGVDSPCVDSGLDLAAGICWTSAGGMECLSELTTRTDGINDQGAADMGYHYPALNPVSAWLSCQPSSGTLPFNTLIALGLDNTLAGEYRQVSGRLDVVLGDGTAYPNWRAGHLVLEPGESFTFAWSQQLPGVQAVVGTNTFTFVAEDVTPAPYNQAPYPPSGSTDWSRCTVTGAAP